MSAISDQPVSTLEQLRQQFDSDPVLSTLQSQLAPEFIQATAAQRKDYLDALRHSHACKSALKKALKPLQGLDSFCKPLLDEAVRQRFGSGYDVDRDTLCTWGMAGFFPDFWRIELTLLESAMHNYEAAEAVKSSSVQCESRDAEGAPHSRQIPYEAFADLSRKLNLGRKYQDHLNSVLEPASAEGDGPDVGRLNMRGLFISNDRADMELATRAALIRKHITTPELGMAVLGLATNRAGSSVVVPSLLVMGLNLLEHDIQRVTLLRPTRTWTFTQVPIVLYIPNDPVCPMKEYGSMKELEDDLRTRLLDLEYQKFFAGFIGEQNRAQFFERLNRHLFPLAPIDGNRFTRGLWEHQPDNAADLLVDEYLITGSLFHSMYNQQMKLIKDNARFLAVPTEDEDAATRRERLQKWLGVGMGIVSAAGFFVPVLGNLLLVYGVTELVSEVYHGLEDLSHGEIDQAIEHLTDAAENIAFMVVLAKLGAEARLPEPPPMTSNNFTTDLVPVKLNNGELRLWKPDVTPFQAKVKLPEGLSPEIDGILHHQGKHYIRIEGLTYEIAREPVTNQWRIQHPDPYGRYSPTVQHNGSGAFTHFGETPQRWSGTRLFRRLGHSVEGLDEQTANQILTVTGIDEPLLRDVHTEAAVPPGQLQDSIKRFQFDRQVQQIESVSDSTRQEHFEALYRDSEQPTDPLVQLLRRDFPGLPAAAAEDIVADVSTTERQALLADGRVALRHGEAAAWHLRQTRVNRALEGFYLKSVNNPDTDRLRLRLLEKLPGWSDDVRIEVREGSRTGPLLDSVGAAHARQVKTLVRHNGRYQAMDADGNDLNSAVGERNNFCDAVMHALPDAARQAIGLPHTWQGEALNDALSRMAGDRQQAFRLLGMADNPMKFNRPQRLSRGRLGYALSGRGRLPDAVLEDHLLDKIALLEPRDITPRQVLQALRDSGLSSADINAQLNVLMDERQALRVSFDEWAMSSSNRPPLDPLQEQSRRTIGEAILQAWQGGWLSGQQNCVTLRLNAVLITEFPMQLPAFFYRSVRRLELEYLAPSSLTTQAYVQSLEQLLARFDHLQSLAVTNPERLLWMPRVIADLPEVIANHCPQLQELDLTRQRLRLTGMDMVYLSRLSQLRRLELNGNDLSAVMAVPFTPPRVLEWLGMASTRLTHWPVWLNALLPGQVRGMSLANNMIADLPDHVVHNTHSAEHVTTIDVRGNPLSRRTVLEAMLNQRRQRASFRLDLDVPESLREQIDILAVEQSALERVLKHWLDAGGEELLPDGQRQLSRQGLHDSLFDQWRSNASGRVDLPLQLESIALSQLPAQLPETFYRRFSGLVLRNVMSQPQQLHEFVRRFAHVQMLEITNHVPPLTAPPTVLEELANLNELGLMDNAMLMDQAAFDFLSRLPRLQDVDVSGNRLGDNIDVTLLSGRRWASLTFERMGLQHWPDWINGLLPASVRSLSFADNAITQLPDVITANPPNDFEHTEIMLTGNPLTRQTMEMAHSSEGANRPFSFYMDLPPDLMEQRFDSDSSSDDEAIDDGPDPVAQWLSGPLQQQQAHRQVWAQIEQAADANTFLRLIRRLPRSADFRMARASLTSRVWRVLQAAAQDPALRVLLDGMAQEAIDNNTCEDGIRLEFNQMEIQVFTRTSLRDVPDAQRGETLYRLMRRLYRLNEVDRLARINSGNRDEAEVRMIYRVELARRLDLPLAPDGMLYRRAAALRPDELLEVSDQVLRSQASAAFMSNAANTDFWTNWLREAHQQEFENLKTVFEQERERLEDRFPELDETYLDQAKALDEDQKRREVELINSLTAREGLKYDN